MQKCLALDGLGEMQRKKLADYFRNAKQAFS
jgi:hypothetical protein